MNKSSHIPIFIGVGIEQLILKDLIRRKTITALDKPHTTTSDGVELDAANLLEQVGAAHLHRVQASQEVSGRGGRVVRHCHIMLMLGALLFDEVLDGVRHRVHRVDDEMDERVLGDVQLLFACAQATRRRPPVVRRVRDVFVECAVELLLPELAEPRVSSVCRWF